MVLVCFVFLFAAGCTTNLERDSTGSKTVPEDPCKSCKNLSDELKVGPAAPIKPDDGSNQIAAVVFHWKLARPVRPNTKVYYDLRVVKDKSDLTGPGSGENTKDLVKIKIGGKESESTTYTWVPPAGLASGTYYWDVVPYGKRRSDREPVEGLHIQDPPTIQLQDPATLTANPAYITNPMGFVSATIKQVQVANTSLINMNAEVHEVTVTREGTGGSTQIQSNYCVPAEEPTRPTSECYLLLYTPTGQATFKGTTNIMDERTDSVTVSQTQTATASFSMPMKVIDVDLDINNSNSLHPDHTGDPIDDLVPVKIKAGANPPFDFTSINMSTLKFGPNRAATSSTTPEYVESDVVFRFPMSEAGMLCEDPTQKFQTDVTFSGRTNIGLHFASTDTMDAQCDLDCHEQEP